MRTKTLLDIGAGLLAIIAARDFNCTVTTIDVAEDKLQEATHDAEMGGLGALITVEHGDASALSYPDRSFEGVICLLRCFAPYRASETDAMHS